LFGLHYLPNGQEVAATALSGMFNASSYRGVGFSLGGGVNVNVVKTRLPGSLGEYFWTRYRPRARAPHHTVNSGCPAGPTGISRGNPLADMAMASG
jgi:hypothetical protein